MQSIASPCMYVGKKDAMAISCDLEDLADDLLVAILSFLPWNEVLRCRVVCVKWNEVLRSADLRTGWRGRDPNQAPLCFIGCKEFGLSVYNPSGHIWQVFGSDYPSSFFTFTSKFGHSYQTTDVRVVGAAHGLLLLQVFLPGNLKLPVGIELFVMNPLDPSTKKRIPLLPELENHFASKPLGIAWNEITYSHQILLQYNPEGPYPYPGDHHEESKMWTFYNYDLKRDKWEKIARWPGDEVREFQNPSIQKGRFHCLGKANLTIMPFKFRSYGLDNAKENRGREPMWIEDKNPSTPSRVQFATLVHDDQGSLLACGNVQSTYVNFDKRPVLKKFSVWKLQTEKMAQKTVSKYSQEDVDKWVEAYKMPEAIVQKINDRNQAKQFQCAATDKFICVANSVRNGAIFDITRNVWWALPTHPLKYSTDLPGQGEVLNWLGLKKLDLHLCEPRFDILL